MTKKIDQCKRERLFNENLVKQYLKHGSVDEAMRANRYSLPISYAGYQRVLDKWGIVKAAGPNSKMSEIFGFLDHLAEENIPFEKLYKKMPPSFMTSAATLYRILAYIKEGITRRVGTGLIITPHNSEEKVLIGDDVSTPRIELGKPYGAISLPMGFAKKRDPRESAILRVLQQEVFSNHAIKDTMPDVVPDRPKPFMYLDIADVRVEMFHLTLPKRYSRKSFFSSYKLKDHRFVSLNEIKKIKKSDLRVGVSEIVDGHKRYLRLKARNLTVNPLLRKSELNYQLAEVREGYQ